MNTHTVKIRLSATITPEMLESLIADALQAGRFGPDAENPDRMRPYAQVLSAEMVKEEADRIVRADYWDDVRGVVEDAKRAILDGELADREALSDWLHETIDGHGRVIYTAQAMEGLCYSDNDGAYIDDFGTDGVVKDGAINWSALMFAAMERDVIDHIGDDDEGESIVNADGFCPTCRKAGTITCTSGQDEPCDDHQGDDDEPEADDQGEAHDDSNEAIRRRLEGGN